MPKNSNQNDDIEIVIEGDESGSAVNTPDNHGGEDTLQAKINEAQSPDTSSAEEAEGLEAKLKAKSRNERQLGSIASQATKLLSKAIDGEDIFEDIENSAELKSYFTKKHPDFLKKFQGFSQETEKTEKAVKSTDEIISEVENRISEKQLDKQIYEAIVSSGIKGSENAEKIKNSVKSLSSQGIPFDKALEAAYIANGVNNIKTHPVIKSQPRLDTQSRITITKAMADKYGTTTTQLSQWIREGKVSQTTLNFLRNNG